MSQEMMAQEMPRTNRDLISPESQLDVGAGVAHSVESPVSVMSQDGNRYPIESIRSLRAIESVAAPDEEFCWEVRVELESHDGKDNPMEQMRRGMALDEVCEYLKAFTVSGLDFVLVDNARRAINPIFAREYPVRNFRRSFTHPRPPRGTTHAAAYDKSWERRIGAWR